MGLGDLDLVDFTGTYCSDGFFTSTAKRAVEVIKMRFLSCLGGIGCQSC